LREIDQLQYPFGRIKIHKKKKIIKKALIKEKHKLNFSNRICQVFKIIFNRMKFKKLIYRMNDYVIKFMVIILKVYVRENTFVMILYF